MLKEILKGKPGEHVSSGKFSISSIGNCWRKKYSEIKGIYKEEFTEKVLRIFATGDFFHQQMISEIVSKGPNMGYYVAAAEINIRDMDYISGRCDMILSHAKSKELYIVDFKSCSSWVFKNAKEGEVPQNYKDQVLLYEHIFHIPRGYLLFINKATSEIEEYEVEYNKERAEFLINQIKFFFNNFVEKDKIPPRCNGGIWGCACCWQKEFKNKPTKEQMQALIKQQYRVPELFKAQPKTEIAPKAVSSDSGAFKSSSWVKV